MMPTRDPKPWSRKLEKNLPNTRGMAKKSDNASRLHRHRNEISRTKRNLITILQYTNLCLKSMKIKHEEDSD